MATSVSPRRPARRRGKRTVLSARGGLGLGRPPRAQNQFATHIPILVGLAQVFPIRRVLELGCGTYSTLTFLSRAAFPHLIELDSPETDVGWVHQLSIQTAGDSRIRIRLVQDPIENSLLEFKLVGYDLIFIDHSISYETRAATISSLTMMPFGSAMVVMHDYELAQYRDASRRFPHRFEFAMFNPSTCVAWGDALVRTWKLHSLARTLKRHASTMAIDDVSGWSNLLRAELANIT
jgi:hypothetical protein